jgi:hypothetical protein
MPIPRGELHMEAIQLWSKSKKLDWRQSWKKSAKDVGIPTSFARVANSCPSLEDIQPLTVPRTRIWLLYSLSF